MYASAAQAQIVKLNNLRTMYRYPFAVADKVYCVWEYDLPDRNRRFLESLDPQYFSYVVERHIDQLNGENRSRAALALRTAYHHGLETLFSFLGALAQSPDSVPSWLPKCSNSTLRDIVRSLSEGRPLLTQGGRCPVTFDQLSQIVHSFCWVDEDPPGATASHFAKLWSRFAQDFLDEHHIDEYNSIKHGFRVAAGGFVLRIGEEHAYGVRPPDHEMQTVGGSPYGTRFYAPEPLPGAEQVGHHFRIRQYSLNWSVEALIQRLQLVTQSIQNTVGALRCLNGSQPGTVLFRRPADPDAFDAAWRWSVGITCSNMDSLIGAGDVSAVPREVLIQELEGRVSSV